MTPTVPTDLTYKSICSPAGCNREGEGDPAAQQNQKTTWSRRPVREESPVASNSFNAPQCGEPSYNSGKPPKCISSREPGRLNQMYVSAAETKKEDELPGISSLPISGENISKAGSSEKCTKPDDNTSEATTLSCKQLAAKVHDDTSVKENIPSRQTGIVSSADGLASEIWKDTESDNTVIFALNKDRMMDKSYAERQVRSNFRTPAATVLINGEPVTFYMNWCFNEPCGDAFLVARDTRYVSQVTAYEEKLKLFTEICKQPPSTVEDFKLLASLEVRNGKPARVCNSKLKPGIHDFYLCNHPTRDFTSDIHLKPEVSDDSFNWKRDTDWSLSVTDYTGRVLTKLEDIHFQDEADTYLLDGHAMDAWREDEVINHIRGVHLPPLPATTTEEEAMKAKLLQVFELAKLMVLPPEQSKENSSGINCKFLPRYKKAAQALHTFWQDLEKILREPDTPDQLHFRVSLSLRTERDPLAEPCVVSS